MADRITVSESGFKAIGNCLDGRHIKDDLVVEIGYSTPEPTKRVLRVLVLRTDDIFELPARE